MKHVLIVDDEVEARVAMKIMLSRAWGVECQIHEADDVQPAIEQLKKYPIDLLFLDIQLKSGNGFEVLKAAEKRDFNLIFTTAYEQYAIQAFKFSAVDYLLKPFGIDELTESLGRVFKMPQNEESSEMLEQMLKIKTLDRIMLPTPNGYEQFKLEAIIRVQADTNYSTFYHVSGKKTTVAKTLKSYEDMLKGSGFLRVHQSHLVNSKFVKRVQGGKEFSIELNQGEKLPISRRKFSEVRQALGL